ncbi:21 kDa protein [Rehmannia virus 1]|uniref:21 kDa protein n=1 Tax=Rehmannia virus 1 TaxID=2316740 RepID=A0A385HW53_9CLOS|nr:21 kDa protein [Rehmannia virus 1]AXY55032.1 21 kDa protein [Rehmannia virus 1]
MKLYINVGYYKTYLKMVVSLLTTIESTSETDIDVNKWIEDFTDLATRIQALKSDVNDAKREENECDINKKAHLLEQAEEKLARIRDELRKLSCHDLINLDNKDLIKYFVTKYMTITSRTLDTTLAARTKDVSTVVLRNLSTEKGLNISTNTFKQSELLRLKSKLGIVWKYHLGYDEKELA